jgi:hypothetical protein
MKMEPISNEEEEEVIPVAIAMEGNSLSKSKSEEPNEFSDVHN